MGRRKKIERRKKIDFDFLEKHICPYHIFFRKAHTYGCVASKTILQLKMKYCEEYEFEFQTQESQGRESTPIIKIN